MAGVVLIADSGTGPPPREELGPAVALLAHRGPDGCRTVGDGWYALAHLHHWTTPEEVGEAQPLADPAAGLTLALCGRIDNREELLGRLGLGAETSDAALVLAAYREWREAAFGRLLGPFAVVVVEAEGRRVVLARDPVGDRGLFWSLEAGRLLVASEEVGVLALRKASDAAVNPRQLARWFAVTDFVADETFFEDVFEVEAGTTLVFSGGVARRSRFWDGPATDTAPRSDREWEEALGETLERAVAARSRTHLRPAVLMSGGLDSTSVAALAAGRDARPLLAVSWIFDQLADADERAVMEPVADRLALDWVPIAADRLWPLRGFDRWPNHPNAPLEGLFRWPRLHAYRQARERGAGILLTGENGDHLFARRDLWLRSALRSGRWGVAFGGVASILRDASRWGPEVSLRSSVGRAVGWRPRWGGWSTRLAPEALALLPERDPRSEEPGRARRRIFDSWSQRGFVWEARHAAVEGLEVRRPFRDRRLLELALSVPPHQLHRPPFAKSLLRRAMRSRLPPEAVGRTWRSTLSPLAQRGLDEREKAHVDRLLERPEAGWRTLVRSEWLYPDGRRRRIDDGPDGAMVWGCVTLEMWRDLLSRRERWRAGRADLPPLG